MTRTITPNIDTFNEKKWTSKKQTDGPAFEGFLVDKIQNKQSNKMSHSSEKKEDKPSVVLEELESDDSLSSTLNKEETEKTEEDSQDEELLKKLVVFSGLDILSQPEEPFNLHFENQLEDIDILAKIEDVGISGDFSSSPVRSFQEMTIPEQVISNGWDESLDSPFFQNQMVNSQEMLDIQEIDQVDKTENVTGNGEVTEEIIPFSDLSAENELLSNVTDEKPLSEWKDVEMDSSFSPLVANKETVASEFSFLKEELQSLDQPVSKVTDSEESEFEFDLKNQFNTEEKNPVQKEEQTSFEEVKIETSNQYIKNSASTVKQIESQSEKPIHIQEIPTLIKEWSIEASASAELGKPFETTLHLTPEHLGNMTVNIQKKSGQLEAIITVEKAESKEMIEKQWETFQRLLVPTDSKSPLPLIQRVEVQVVSHMMDFSGNSASFEQRQRERHVSKNRDTFKKRVGENKDSIIQDGDSEIGRISLLV